MAALNQLGKDLNAYTVNFTETLLEEIRLSYDRHLRNFFSEYEKQDMLKGGVAKWESLGEYFLASFGTSSLFWLSNNTAATYQIYRNFLDELDIGREIKNLIDCKHKIVMYSGFLVISNQFLKPKWHIDYFPGANSYTLITPLFELHKSHGNLLYKSSDDTIQKYNYKLGEAIIFGDYFNHSTESYKPSENIRVLMSMTFGSDKIKYWSILSKTVGKQSNYSVLPCGHIAGTCQCQKLFELSISYILIKLFLSCLVDMFLFTQSLIIIYFFWVSKEP